MDVKKPKQPQALGEETQKIAVLDSIYSHQGVDGSTCWVMVVPHFGAVTIMTSLGLTVKLYPNVRLSTLSCFDNTSFSCSTASNSSCAMVCMECHRYKRKRFSNTERPRLNARTVLGCLRISEAISHSIRERRVCIHLWL